MTPNPSLHRAESVGLTLGELASILQIDAATIRGFETLRLLDVTQDSRKVRPCALFVAKDGGRVRGTDLIGQALAAGAVAILAQQGTVEPTAQSVPVLVTPDLQRALATAAEAVHGQPTRSIPLVGITGTNGKTTTVALLHSAIRAAGGRPGRIGTLGTAFDDVEQEGLLTTPEADDLSRFAGSVVAQGGTHLLMEVSSHSLALDRVAGLQFDVAAFTNLTQDHLDFHGTMEAYAATKQRLFADYHPRVSVINAMDPWGRDYAATARSSRILRVGTSGDVDVRPVDVALDARGLRGDVLVAGRTVRIETRLVGAHNLDNILLALAVLEALGIDLDAAVAAWRDFGVPGRFERCDVAGDDLTVLVDYAHTPDALQRALSALRELTQGALICVFGCGGDRDAKKRPRMGEAAGRLSDRVFVTNDNPRSEAPAAIAQAIVQGLAPTGTPFEVELDRARAIELAIESANRGDVVLIAGKGHEPYQQVGDIRHPFDDRVEARRCLEQRRARRGA